MDDCAAESGARADCVVRTAGASRAPAATPSRAFEESVPYAALTDTFASSQTRSCADPSASREWIVGTP
ncbi:MAG: hypothetical protein SF028_09845 [Candidatus Sumerlaeia bacterium]|nr:hypothetical protein [Candidatus Sumerlaeia bacterium]